MLGQRVADLDFDALRGRTYHPSPAAWEDEVLYFLLVDRFSDGAEDGYRGNDGGVVAGRALRAGDEIGRASCRERV